MINLRIQKIEGLWCGVSIEKDKIFATAFAFNEKHVLTCLLK